MPQHHRTPVDDPPEPVSAEDTAQAIANREKIHRLYLRLAAHDRARADACRFDRRSDEDRSVRPC